MSGEPIRPKRLEPGDHVRIVSPSSPVASLVPRRLARAARSLESLGYKAELGVHATDRLGHTAGTIEARVADLHDAFLDPGVGMVLASIGGFNSHQVLESLDFDLIRDHPKILMGYSDITALLTAVHVKTGLVTFLGPAALPQFGEAGGLMAYTKQMWERVVTRAEAAGELQPAAVAVAERLRWDADDTRPRRLEPHPLPIAFRSGEATGPVLAGNLGTLLLLAQTPYWPDMRGRILLVEDDEDESPDTLDRYFTQLRHMGVYRDIAGLGVGRLPPEVGLSPDDSLEAIVAQATHGFDFPIALDLDFGHWDPIMTLPLGVQARLVVEDGRVTLSLLEAAVS